MKVVIIEDEALAATRLQQLLAEVAPHIQVIATLASVKESVQWLQLHQADLLFLDIQLSDGLSFSIFDSIPVTTPVIFTTAYDQYAIKAFQVNSIDYLLKPVNKRHLLASLNKYQQLQSAFTIDFDRLLEGMQGRVNSYKTRFMVYAGDKIKKVSASEVAYCYAMEKAVFLTTRQGTTYDIDTTLDQLQQELDPRHFFRINRKYLIHIDAISRMHTWSRGRVRIELNPPPDNGEAVTVSIDRAKDFKQWLNS